MKKLFSYLLLLALLLPTLSACRQTTAHSSSFFLMDTTVTVTLYTEDKDLAEEQLAACRALMQELDALWSAHSSEGDVAKINAASTAAIPLDSRTLALLRQAKEISRQTDGAFDITLLPLSELWQSCAEQNRLPTELECEQALASRNMEGLTVTETELQKPQEVRIDLGGIGKGAAISLMLEQLCAAGISGGLISFGSNVAVFGQKPDATPYRIALRDPADATATVGTLTLQDGEILSVSGDYERFVTIDGKQYHHILDPLTGYPADTGLSSVAVICRDGAPADALSTALFVMGQEAAMELYRSGIYQFEAILISQDGTVTTTAGLHTFDPARK